MFEMWLTHLLAMTHPKAKGERFLCMSPGNVDQGRGYDFT